MSAEQIREKITHILTIYPVLSPSMLQTGLGNLKPRDWRPILEQMIEEAVVGRAHDVILTPNGADRSYTTIYLNAKA